MLIGNKCIKTCWFCGDAVGELALVGFSVVNALSDERYWCLYLGFSSSGSLFLKLGIWGDWLQHSGW